MKEGQILAKKVFTQNQLSSPGGTVVLFPSPSNEGHPYKEGPSPMKTTANDQRGGRNTARPHSHTHCASPLCPPSALQQKTIQSWVPLSDPSLP